MSNVALQFLDYNKEVDYPFRDGSSLSDTDRSIFLDAYFVHRRVIKTDVVVSTVWLNAANYNTSGGLVLKDTNGNTIFDGSDFDETREDVSSDALYHTFTWVRTDVGDEAQLVLVVNADVSGYGTSARTPNSPLVTRCVERMPDRVNRLFAKNSGGSPSSVTTLAEGTNCQIIQSPLSLQDFAIPEPQIRPESNRLQISAIAGAGTGREEQDCDVTGILSINRITGADGRFILEPDDCYWFNRRDVASSSAIFLDDTIRVPAGRLKLHNECEVCCDCDKFEAFYERIRTLVNRGCQVFSDIKATAAIYESIVAEFTERANCSVTTGQVTARIAAYAYTGWLTQVLIVLVNGTACPIDGFFVNVSIDGTPPAEYVDGTGLVFSNADGITQVDPSITTDVNSNEIGWQMLNMDTIPGAGFAYITLGIAFLSDVGRVEGAPKRFDALVSSNALAISPTALSATVELIGNRAKS